MLELTLAVAALTLAVARRCDGYARFRRSRNAINDPAQHFLSACRKVIRPKNTQNNGNLKHIKFTTSLRLLGHTAKNAETCSFHGICY
jgi:hypothetical protein